MTPAATRRRSLPLWAKRIIWHLDGRSIRFWIALRSVRYKVGVGVASRVCRGDRWGDHTGDAYDPLTERCFCDRTRRRLDFIPF